MIEKHAFIRESIEIGLRDFGDDPYKCLKAILSALKLEEYAAIVRHEERATIEILSLLHYASPEAYKELHKKA